MGKYSDTGAKAIKAGYLAMAEELADAEARLATARAAWMVKDGPVTRCARCANVMTGKANDHGVACPVRLLEEGDVSRAESRKDARVAYEEARIDRDEARVDRDEAGNAYDKASNAYDEASNAYYKARDAYEEATAAEEASDDE